jgi:hypothetical protein
VESSQFSYVRSTTGIHQDPSPYVAPHRGTRRTESGDVRHPLPSFIHRVSHYGVPRPKYSDVNPFLLRYLSRPSLTILIPLLSELTRELAETPNTRRCWWALGRLICLKSQVGYVSPRHEKELELWYSDREINCIRRGGGRIYCVMP